MLPWLPNTTCDIYRAGHAPPATPDVQGVVCFLIPCFERGREQGETESETIRYTHLLHVELATDIRDNVSEFAQGGSPDVLYVPDKNGIPFKVVFVERVARNSATDCKKVYLNRKLPIWPLNANQCTGQVSGGGGGSNVTACCPGGLPDTLHATLGNLSGCACLDGLSIAINWNGTGWSGSYDACSLTGNTISLNCVGGIWQLSGTGCVLFNIIQAPGGSCSPLSFAFSSNVSGCCTGTITITITT